MVQTIESGMRVIHHYNPILEKVDYFGRLCLSSVEMRILYKLGKLMWSSSHETNYSEFYFPRIDEEKNGIQISPNRTKH